MQITLHHRQKQYSADLSKTIVLANTLKDGDANPNCYYADSPHFETIRSGDFIGSVAEGGSVNHKKLHLSPHGNGTHTECYGHISSDPQATIDRCLVRSHFIAQLIAVTPEKLDNGDEIITWQAISNKIGGELSDAIIIRTLSEVAESKKWSGTNPPYFHHEVGEQLAKCGISHIITDLPSVDRETDGGKLQMHNAFWQTKGQLRQNATITELAMIPADIADGLYLLDLQTPRMSTDAVPSRPVIFKLESL